MKTLIIDNYDSYTHILAQLVWKANGEKPIVIKNDSLSVEDIKVLEFDNIVISPGPGYPGNAADFGVCMDIFEVFRYTPVLGVCLGHQGLGFYAGAKVKRADRIMHGKYSEIKTRGTELFAGIPERFRVVRYHSFLVDAGTVPENMDVLAETTRDNLVMAIKMKDRPHYGIQFHPESAGTENGEKILENFRKITEKWKLKLKRGRSAVNKKFYYTEIPWQESESVFEKLFAGESCSFWLDSSLAGRNGRFSYMGSGRAAVESRGGAENPFRAIRKLLAESRVKDKKPPFDFCGGLVGYLGYELKEFLDLGPAARDTGALPDCFFMKVDKFIAFDHKKKKMWVCVVAGNKEELDRWVSEIRKKLKTSVHKSFVLRKSSGGKTVSRLRGIGQSVSRAGYLKSIRHVLGKIRNGETYEACLTNEFYIKARPDPFRLYKVLRLVNPAPYSAYINTPGGAVLSSSPELFLKLDRSGDITSEPIKGTRMRGACGKETAELARDLKDCGKDMSELLMIIDLVRNDIAKVSRRGSVKVAEFARVSEYATVIQLSSVIKGILQEGLDAVDLVQAAFPGGSVTGAPKRRTIQILDGLEKRPRGVYTGSIGYFSNNGAMHLNIAIRTMTVDRKGLRFGAGGAIVEQSVPDREYEEILIKAYPLIKAIYLEKFGEFGYDSIVETDGGGRRGAGLPALREVPDFKRLFNTKD